MEAAVLRPGRPGLSRSRFCRGELRGRFAGSAGSRPGPRPWKWVFESHKPCFGLGLPRGQHVLVSRLEPLGQPRQRWPKFF